MKMEKKKLTLGCSEKVDSDGRKNMRGGYGDLVVLISYEIMD